ncbi:hypothetical protein BH10PLA1_BH10PLA1_21330 [soil metagenome]
MRLALTSCLGLVLLICARSAIAKPDADGFKHIPLISRPEFDVELLVRPIAMPADEQFIGFLIVNKTASPLQLGQSCQYQIRDAQRFELGTNKLISTGSLASGNYYDLLHRDLVNPNTTQPPLPVGASRHLNYSSSYSLGLLGIPAKNSAGYHIKSVVHLTMEYDRKMWSTPPAGVPIEFDWMPPDEKGIGAMRIRLQQLLKNGDPGQRFYNVMAASLDYPEVGGAMTGEELIAGLWSWGQCGGKVLEFIDAHRPNDALLVQYALDLAARNDYLHLLVLKQSKSLHDARLIDPYRHWVLGQSDRYGWESALELLSKQLDLAADRPAITAELGKEILSRCPLVQSGKLGGDDPWHWNNEVDLLALTRDKNLIPSLLPYLDHDEVVIDAKRMSLMNNGVSTRVCDVTFNAILDLLERKGERFSYHTEGIRIDPRREYVRRDALIAAMKNELTK